MAIVPPDMAWDTLQQARHWVQDSTASIWPPAIRLFHPFLVDNDAAIFAMAECIEHIQQEPFQVKLSEWSIIPHQEILCSGFAESDATEEQDFEEDVEYKEIKKLIEREEAIGKVNKARRKKHALNKTGVAGRPRTKNRNEQYEPSPSQPDEFNGACVIVLEPDETSRRRLCALRQALVDALAEHHVDAFDGLYSCTGTMPHKTTPYPATLMETEWRPVVPIASVSTTAAAIPLARHLRASWEPIVFNVTDLHVISASTDEAFGCDALISFIGEEPMNLDDPVHQEMAFLLSDHGNPGGADNESSSQSGFIARTSITPSVEEIDDETEHGPNMGNDVGAWNEGDEEISALDENDDFYYPSVVDPNSDTDEEYLSPQLEQWLYQDDDEYDADGSVVVLGRVQFFTGSQRDYVGMPAISALDQKFYTQKEKTARLKRAAKNVKTYGPQEKKLL